MCTKWSVGLVGVVLVFTAAVTGNAETIVAGTSFDDNAFPDVILNVAGNPSFQRIVGPTAFDRVATTAEDALLGADLASMTIEMQSSQSVSLGFTDNFVVNGPGDDLAIFEEFSSPEGGCLQVEIGGEVKAFSTQSIGQHEVSPGVTNYINLGTVNLDDFGFAPNETTQWVTLWGVGSEFAVVGALNSAPVPAPSTLVGLVSMGAIGLVIGWRRRFGKR